MVYDLNAIWIIWAILIKTTFIVVIVGLSYGDIVDQGFSFDDVLDRATNNESFSRTDFFGIAAHFLFIQVNLNQIGLVEQSFLIDSLTDLCLCNVL